MVFEKHRSLPDDRGRLVDLLLSTALCRSRRSRRQRAPQIGSWMSPGKKTYLEGSPWLCKNRATDSAIGRAIEIAIQLLPPRDPLRQQRAKRHVDWAVQTIPAFFGFKTPRIMRNKLDSGIGYFAKHLAANQLVGEDPNTVDKVRRLWEEKRLIDPFGGCH